VAVTSRFDLLKPPRNKALFGLVAAAVVIVAGCGSDTARSAEGEELPATDEVVVVDETTDANDEGAAADSDATIDEVDEPATDATTDDSAAAAQLTGSYATFISLENQLTLPSGDPTTITWNVSNTENKYWDGNSRPDHNPPDGVQGLVQKTNDGPHTVRLEANSSAVYGPEMQFTLTPVVTLKGNNPVNLQSIDFKFYNSWYCPDGGRTCKQNDKKFQPMWEGFIPGDVACRPTAEKTFTASVANQQVTYGFVGQCDPAKQPSTFKIINIK
jgi:hypothetical protein